MKTIPEKLLEVTAWIGVALFSFLGCFFLMSLVVWIFNSNEFLLAQA